jgi:Cysteine-rich CPXCG
VPRRFLRRRRCEVRGRQAEDEMDADAPAEEPIQPEDRIGSDSELQTEAEVTCPYCGESIAITLDAAGGATQEYVEDCQVCCRPWQVHVNYDEGGTAQVWVEQSE